MKFNEYGTGAKTIILVHGGPSLYGYMMSLGDQLTDKFKVIDYSQRGSEGNPYEGEDLGIDLHIKDLNEIVDQVEGKPILIGHSWGANLSLFYAAEHSEEIEKVISLGTASLTEEMGDLFSEIFASRITEADKTQLENINRKLEDAKTDSKINELMNERLSITSPLYHFDRKTEEKLPVCKWNFSTFQDSIDSLWDLIEDGKVPGLLKKISCPVIAIQGDTDVFPPKETFLFLKENISNFESHEIQNAGHFPWLEEENEEFLRKLIEACEN